MNKIKWKYDKKYKYWWTNETAAWANYGFTIKKDESYYVLEREYYFIGRFNKIKNAKTVAELLKNG